MAHPEIRAWAVEGHSGANHLSTWTDRGGVTTGPAEGAEVDRDIAPRRRTQGAWKRCEGSRKKKNE